MSRQPEQSGALLATTSWDDGHPSDLRVADLLEKHGLDGTFYVPCVNAEGRPVMHKGQVAQLGDRFEIGGHTRDHLSLTGMSPDRAAEQIRGNKLRLEDILGREVRGFAYVRGHHDATVRGLVANAGYRYARTVRNLMSTPGGKRLEVPTTTQFYPHKPATYAKNYLSGGPSFQRAAILSALLGKGDLAMRLLNAAQACLRSGGCFHLWGHSWELDEHGLWAELDRFFSLLQQLRPQSVANAEWCGA
jgi:peptidoglycan/xylan/chitin deacetylase (PgdA/CDA1 family)